MLKRRLARNPITHTHSHAVEREKKKKKKATRVDRECEADALHPYRSEVCADIVANSCAKASLVASACAGQSIYAYMA